MLMKKNNELKTFIKNNDFSDENISNFISSKNINEKEFINILILELDRVLLHCSCTNNFTFYLDRLVSLLSLLINRNEFNNKEIQYIKRKVKFSRQVILSYLINHDNDILLSSANTLDELVIDKNNDINSLLILIKKLIVNHEDSNIIKKFVSSNKDVLTKNNYELFDIAFKKAINSLVNNTDDIYYYLTLLKIFYHTNINKMKYYKMLNNFKGENSVFLRQMYMIVQGIKRGLNLQDINDKYGFIKPSYEDIFIPNRDSFNGLTFSIDSRSTGLYDDAISVKKDGDKYIISIFVADAGGTINHGSSIDIDAMNNFKSVYVAGSGIRMLNSKIEKQLSLNGKEPRNAIMLNVVLNNSGDIIDYSLKENEITVDYNMSYNEADSLLCGLCSNEFSRSVFDLYMLSKALEANNASKGQYWKLKNNNSPKYTKNFKSETIVSEFAVLYNRIVAMIAKEAKFPFVYKSQREQYLSDFISFNYLKVNDATNKLIENTYLQSEYSSMPLPHYGLGFDEYTKVCNPLREYPCLYNQYLLHQFYFKDIFMNFDYQSYLDMIDYFNKRSEEISLYKGEYEREARLIKKK